MMRRPHQHSVPTRGFSAGQLIVGILVVIVFFASTRAQTSWHDSKNGASKAEPVSSPRGESAGGDHLVHSDGDQLVHSGNGLWDQLSALTNRHRKARVSGGIFLHKRQTTLLAHLSNVLAAHSSDTSTADGRVRVCETGFAAGHNAALWLASSPKIDVLSFDTFDRPYQMDCLNLLGQHFPGRIRRITGDNCETLPKYLAENERVPCDMVHASSLCAHDTHNLYQLSRCGTLVTASAMDSLKQNSYFGKDGNGEWSRGCEAGWLDSVLCFEEAAFNLTRNFVFAARHTSAAHKFCLGVFTGQCSAEDALSAREQTRSLVLAAAAELHIAPLSYSTMMAMVPERVRRSGCLAQHAGRLAQVSPLANGTVLRDFSTRVLARSTAQTAVVAVGSESVLSASAVVDTARREGHRLIMHTGPAAVDGWWDSLGHARPDWVLLLYIADTDTRGEVSALASASNMLANTTVTYIVVRFLPTPQGRQAVEVLLAAHYRVQILSCTHAIPGYGPNVLLTRDNLHHFALLAGAVGADTHLFGTQGLDLAIPSFREYLDVAKLTGCAKETGLEKAARVREGCAGHIPQGVPLIHAFKRCPQQSAGVLLRWAHGADQLELQCGKGSLIQQGSDAWAAAVLDVWLGHAEPRHAEAACVRAVCTPRVSASNDAAGVDHPPRQEVVCAARIARPSKALSPVTPPRVPLPKLLPRTRPNLLLLVVDAVSRAQFKSTLPRTQQLLRAHGFTHYSHFAVVGANSGPNQAALYSGAPQTGRDPYEDGKRAWLWDELAAAGYATFKSADECDRSSGMARAHTAQTHHGAQVRSMLCFDFARPNCLAGELAAQHVLDHSREFVETYSETRPWAAMLHLVDGHEDSMVLSHLLDEPVRAFLDWLLREKGGALAGNTIVVVLSDHGLHYGPHFQGPTGVRERAEPVLFLKAPKATPGQLGLAQENAERLVTPYDVHDTLQELLGLSSAGEAGSWASSGTQQSDNPSKTEERREQITERKETRRDKRADENAGTEGERGQGGERASATRRFGRSLLRLLPEARTCAEAGVPPQFCLRQTQPQPQPPAESINGNGTEEATCKPGAMPGSVLGFYAEMAADNRPGLRSCGSGAGSRLVPWAATCNAIEDPEDAGCSQPRLGGFVGIRSSSARWCRCASTSRDWTQCAAAASLPTEPSETDTRRFLYEPGDDFVLVLCNGKLDVHVTMVREERITQRSRRLLVKAGGARREEEVSDHAKRRMASVAAGSSAGEADHARADASGSTTEARAAAGTHQRGKREARLGEAAQRGAGASQRAHRGAGLGVAGLCRPALAAHARAGGGVAGRGGGRQCGGRLRARQQRRRSIARQRLRAPQRVRGIMDWGHQPSRQTACAR